MQWYVYAMMYLNLGIMGNIPTGYLNLGIMYGLLQSSAWINHDFCFILSTSVEMLTKPAKPSQTITLLLKISGEYHNLW